MLSMFVYIGIPIEVRKLVRDYVGNIKRGGYNTGGIKGERGIMEQEKLNGVEKRVERRGASVERDN